MLACKTLRHLLYIWYNVDVTTNVYIRNALGIMRNIQNQMHRYQIITVGTPRNVL